MFCITLISQCDVIVNVHAQTEVKSDVVKNSLYKELEHVFLSS